MWTTLMLIGNGSIWGPGGVSVMPMASDHGGSRETGAWCGRWWRFIALQGFCLHGLMIMLLSFHYFFPLLFSLSGSFFQFLLFFLSVLFCTAFILLFSPSFVLPFFLSFFLGFLLWILKTYIIWLLFDYFCTLRSWFLSIINYSPPRCGFPCSPSQ